MLPTQVGKNNNSFLDLFGGCSAMLLLYLVDLVYTMVTSSLANPMINHPQMAAVAARLSHITIQDAKPINQPISCRRWIKEFAMLDVFALALVVVLTAVHLDCQVSKARKNASTVILEMGWNTLELETTSEKSSTMGNGFFVL